MRGLCTSDSDLAGGRLNSPSAKRKTLINSALSVEFYRAPSKHKLYIVKGGAKDRLHPYFLSGCN